MRRYLTIINMAAMAACLYLGWQTFDAIQSFSTDIQWSSDMDVRSKTARVDSGAKIIPGYQTIIKRDLFHTKRLSEPVKKEPNVKKMDKTELKLKLWGTVTGESVVPYAVIEDLSLRKQTLYLEGDSVQDARLRVIFRDKIVLQTEGRDEILEMEKFTGQGAAKPVAGRVPTAKRADVRNLPGRNVQPAPNRSGNAGRPQKIVISRNQIAQQLENLDTAIEDVKMTPHQKDSETIGFRITGIKPSSILRRLGLRNGDILKSVDGETVVSPDDMEELISRLAEEDEMEVELSRRGRDRAYRYTVR